ncbi:MAG TPA: hypothetical protein VNT58_09475 [Gaiellaceae bacterium]|nr:hypothetical protein [Gaiellaceae bacterium]
MKTTDNHIQSSYSRAALAFLGGTVAGFALAQPRLVELTADHSFLLLYAALTLALLTPFAARLLPLGRSPLPLPLAVGAAAGLATASQHSQTWTHLLLGATLAVLAAMLAEQLNHAERRLLGLAAAGCMAAAMLLIPETPLIAVWAVVASAVVVAAALTSNARCGRHAS